jgi:hypothetical protein
VLTPLHMVGICTMQHSNLQIKCKFFVAFKVLMLFASLLLFSFSAFVVLLKICWLQSSSIVIKVILVL